MKKIAHKNYPGSQKKLRSFNSLFFLLSLMAGIFLLLTIYSILRDNLYDARINYPRWLWLNILDTKTACTIFVSFISILLVRHHFIIGFKPKIVYECRKTKQPYNAELEVGKILWQVKIKNVGLGTAVFTHYCFRVGISEINSGQYDLDFSQVINTLKANNIFFEDDYYLSNITNGYAMPSKEERIVFEILLPIGYSLKQLDIKMKFEGYLGGLYEKEVFAIPRIGIYNREDNKPSE